MNGFIYFQAGRFTTNCVDVQLLYYKKFLTSIKRLVSGAFGSLPDDFQNLEIIVNYSELLSCNQEPNSKSILNIYLRYKAIFSVVTSL